MTDEVDPKDPTTPEPSPPPRKRKARTAPPPVEVEEPDDGDPLLDLDNRVTDLEEYRMARKAKETEGEKDGGMPQWVWIVIAVVAVAALVAVERFKGPILARFTRAPNPAPPVAP